MVFSKFSALENLSLSIRTDSTFSFFAGHHISTIEGGMVCTDDEELYYQLLMTRSHGWDRSLPKEERIKLSKKYGPVPMKTLLLNLSL